jgi:hypothetical protein
MVITSDPLAKNLQHHSLTFAFVRWQSSRSSAWVDNVKRRSTNDPGKKTELLARVREAAERIYLNRPGVVGVSAGTKFRAGQPTDEVCIQFFVVQKLRGLPSNKSLPVFLCGRKKGGVIDRSVRIKTDVIEVGVVEFSCGGGSLTRAQNEQGTITLIFRNKVAGDNRFLLLTCAHVAGDVAYSPPLNQELQIHRQTGGLLSATTLKNSTHNNGTMEYDIAIARIDDVFPDDHDRFVIQDNIQLDDFLPQDQLNPFLSVKCMLGVSGLLQGQIHSYAGAVKVSLHNRWYTLRNVFVIDRSVQHGDSGGIVYADTKAIGLIVARSPEGWAWFQPLEPAIKHLSETEPKFPLRVF